MTESIKQRLQLLLNAGCLCPRFEIIQSVRGRFKRLAGDIRVFIPSHKEILLYTMNGFWVRIGKDEVFLPTEELTMHTDEEWNLAIAEMKGATDESGT
jgi:hypothetical protein